MCGYGRRCCGREREPQVCLIFVTSLAHPSFPRKRESTLTLGFSTKKWIPACAGMTEFKDDCRVSLV
ncbi:MAG TPA: hypothetical protein DCG63_01135 [Methylophilaceae bacterium]|nr:hypothetical protein [Methylophilaceae bacterium]